jgi:hypothetical protein
MVETISMSFNFGEECKRHQVNQAFAEQVDEKLFPLLETAIEIHSFNFFLVQKYANSQNIFKNFKVFTTFTDKIRRDLTVTREEFAFLFLLSYLVVVESLYAFVVDIIAFALINVGKQLENPRTGKFVVLFNELKELALGTKLDFLKAHKFKIIANRCDITLRNAAAHLDFTLDDKGNIHYKDHVVKGSHDMNTIWEEIREAAICSHIALMHFYYEKYGKYMP